MSRALQTPLSAELARSLLAGEAVRLSGTLYTARDAAHRRLMDCLEQGLPLPFELRDALIYYVGPTPAKPGRVIGSAGPTTSSRMDSYTPALLAAGLRGMIGKGDRSPAVEAAIRQHEAVYFAATGGAGALLAQAIVEAEVIAWPELGPEAVHRLVVRDFPLTVAIDCHGNNLYRRGPADWLAAQVD